MSGYTLISVEKPEEFMESKESYKWLGFGATHGLIPLRRCAVISTSASMAVRDFERAHPRMVVLMSMPEGDLSLLQLQMTRIQNKEGAQPYAVFGHQPITEGYRLRPKMTMTVIVSSDSSQNAIKEARRIHPDKIFLDAIGKHQIDQDLDALYELSNQVLNEYLNER